MKMSNCIKNPLAMSMSKEFRFVNLEQTLLPTELFD